MRKSKRGRRVVYQIEEDLHNRRRRCRCGGGFEGLNERGEMKRMIEQRERVNPESDFWCKSVSK